MVLVADVRVVAESVLMKAVMVFKISGEKSLSAGGVGDKEFGVGQGDRTHTL